MELDLQKDKEYAVNGVRQVRGKKISISNMLMHLVFILITLSCILPLLLLTSISFSKEKDILVHGYSLIPLNFTTDAYAAIFKQPSVIINSYLVTICTTVTGTLVGMWLITTLAFVLSRKDFKYRRHITFYIVFTMLFNGGLIPFYILISKWFGMGDTIFALIIPYLMNAWFVILMRGFMESIPDSLYESAKIDGASELTIFAKIVLPLAKPALATVSLFMVLNYWNDWWLSLLFIENEKLFTLQFLLQKLIKNLEFLSTAIAGKYVKIDPEKIPTLSTRMAMCLIAAGPMLIVFPFFQKYFVRGLTVGSLKG